MSRRRNGSLWGGFVLVLFGLLSYIPIFARFPVTRDFPWVNLLLIGIGGALMARGLIRSFKQPEVYRGKILGTLAALLASVAAGLFCWGLFYIGSQLPDSQAAPRVGAKAPNFTLPDETGQSVQLSELLAGAQETPATGSKIRAVLLIFYRGHW